MLKDITIGQYYPSGSPLHRLDARLKLVSLIALITVLFTLGNAFSYALVYLCVAALVMLSGVPVKFIFRGLKSIFFLVLFTAVLNVLFAQGDTVLVSFPIFSWEFRITLESLLLVAQMTSRMLLLLVSSSLLTLTTTPIQMTDAIEYLIKPLKKIGVPTHVITLTMTITLRFIPALLDEMDKLMKAQTARGADFETGGVIKRAKSLLPILIPLFVSAFRRADELATAMESRCYRGDEGRTRMKTMKFNRADAAAGLVAAVAIALVVAVNVVA